MVLWQKWRPEQDRNETGNTWRCARRRRFTAEYKNSGGANLFDEAYVDVLRGDHWTSSCQLLTWVVVACVWARDAPVERVAARDRSD